METHHILLLYPGAKATFHTFWATSCSSQPGTKITISLTFPLTGDCSNPYVIEGDCYGLPTCAHLLYSAETVNPVKAVLGVKIQKYLGQSSKCTSLAALPHCEFLCVPVLLKGFDYPEVSGLQWCSSEFFLIKPAPVSTHSNCICYGRCDLNSLSCRGEWKHETFG